MGPILVNPGDPPLFVARIPDSIVLPVHDGCRDVCISPEVYRHIIEGRLRDGDAQVALVLQRIASVIEFPRFVGSLTSDSRRVELYAARTEDPAGVCVSIKCLGHETWVNTAFPLGSRRFSALIRQGRLKAV